MSSQSVWREFSLIFQSIIESFFFMINNVDCQETQFMCDILCNFFIFFLCSRKEKYPYWTLCFHYSRRRVLVSACHCLHMLCPTAAWQPVSQIILTLRPSIRVSRWLYLSLFSPLVHQDDRLSICPSLGLLWLTAGVKHPKSRPWGRCLQLQRILLSARLITHTDIPLS